MSRAFGSPRKTNVPLGRDVLEAHGYDADADTVTGKGSCETSLCQHDGRRRRCRTVGSLPEICKVNYTNVDKIL